MKVTSFISDPGQDPHSYEASAQNQLAISKADLVIENGGGYDDFIDRMVKASHAQATVLNVVDISGKKAAAGQQLNEHVWYDFPTVTRLADDLAKALTAIDSKDAAVFQANATAFTDQVQGLVAEEKNLKATGGGGVWPSPSPSRCTCSRRWGCTTRPHRPSVQPSRKATTCPRWFSSRPWTCSTMAKVTALVYNEQTTGPITEQVKKAAEKAGIPVVPVTETLPEGKSYLAWMTENLNNLKRALSGR